jgi:2-polyprenyl-6-methoxyphenol hydroxylase-like FAD-dependent oxidoreductase
MMLGLLLARAGVRVVVLEKHADFLRDFRGDTVHPSTLEVIHELGLLDAFLERPHQKLFEIGAMFGSTRLMLADFRSLPVKCGYIAFMPQWEFLDFIADEARRYSGFELRMETRVTGLIEDPHGRVVGVAADGPWGVEKIRADLIIGADGRRSDVRTAAGLPVRTFGVPMDVLWMRFSRQPDDPEQTFGYIAPGRLFVTLRRDDYWQCALVIPKGGFDELRAGELDHLRARIAGVAPWLEGRLHELTDWDDVKLLTVIVDRLKKWWRPGVLCIGDAAHAMSPLGGVGINLAIQDAVAAANILAVPLRGRSLTEAHLAAVQKRREFPTRVTQRAQLLIQNLAIRNVLASTTLPAPPLPLRLLDRYPHLRRIPARLVGMGVRPEHVRTHAVL